MRPRWVLSPNEVAILDCNAESLGVDMDKLMITEASHLADALENAPSPIWILCGPGNNGGDGFAAALGLVEDGVDARLLATHLIQRGEAAQAFRERSSRAGIPLSIWPEVQSTVGTGTPALVIDCLLGAGPVFFFGSDSRG